jgi:acetyl-CoA C-acetyltransferase
VGNRNIQVRRNVAHIRSGASAAVIGIGEVSTGRFPDRSEIDAAVAVARDAIIDARLGPSDIDVVMPTGALASSHFNTDLVFSRLCEELGMLRSATMNAQVFAGGARVEVI